MGCRRCFTRVILITYSAIDIGNSFINGRAIAAILGSGRAFDKTPTIEGDQCEDWFQRIVTRDTQGRFCVALPFHAKIL